MTLPSPAPHLRKTASGLHSLTCTIDGMKCGQCALAIERSLARLGGVASARVNATTRRLNIEIDRAVTGPEQVFETVAELGYRIHPFPEAEEEASREASLLVPLAVAGFGLMNIMLFSISVWAGLATDMGADTRSLFHWASAAVAAPVVVYSASVFHLPAIAAVRNGRMTMDVPISIAILATFAASLRETLHGADHTYFDAAVSLTFFLLLGRILDQFLRRRSRSAADNLRALTEGNAFLIREDGSTVEIAASALGPGDLVHVPLGARIPADAVLLSDHGEVDESAITGESRPRFLRAGDALTGGSANAGAALRARVTAAGAASRLAHIADLADRAGSHRGRQQLLADRFARGYGPFVTGAAAAGFLGWLLLLDAQVSEAVMIAVAVLVVTCPCAAGLATPAVVTRAGNRLLADGIIVRDGGALERLAEATDIVLDKTGTLTGQELVLDSCPDARISGRAGAIAASSRHPLCVALSRAIRRNPLPGVAEFPGRGLETEDGERLGSAAFVGGDREGPDDGLAEIWYAAPGARPVRFGFSQAVRPGFAETVEGLRRRGLRPLILSGDTPSAVAAVAGKAGIADWDAGRSPEEKLAQIQSMAERGKRVAMLGDGLNDAPALAAAHVSLSPSSATDAAQNAADVILLGESLLPLLRVIDVARSCRRLIAQNLAFAAVYNILSLPLALAGMLTPLAAAILMSSSSLLVMANALRLR